MGSADIFDSDSNGIEIKGSSTSASRSSGVSTITGLIAGSTPLEVRTIAIATDAAVAKAAEVQDKNLSSGCGLFLRGLPTLQPGEEVCLPRVYL